MISKIFSVNRRLWLLASALLITAVSAFAAPKTTPILAASPRLPLSFIANVGQFDPAVRFYLRYGRQSVRIGAGEVTLDDSAAAVRMRFVGASPAVEVEGRDRLPGVAHFYHGNDPKQWATGVSTYATVAQVDLYQGITQIYRGSEGRLKSEFRVAPGADPAAILMEYSGVESLAIDANGGLAVRTVSGGWRESAPVVFQQIGSRRFEVPASFRLLGESQVGFAVGPYDPAHELIIDPTLQFSTYLGGTEGDIGGGIAVDNDGNVLVCGITESTNFPLMNPEVAANAGDIDLFVAKFDANGGLVYSTYMGGSGRELGGDIAVDPEGNAYCVGWTTSDNFPTTMEVLGKTPFGVGGSVDDAAVFKLDPMGWLVYSTYLGGSGDDQPEDIAVDAAGHAYVTGNTVSSDFPTKPGAFSTSKNQGVWDVFVSKLKIDASDLVYSTFIGDSGYDEPMAIALDAEGNAYITGRTQSKNFPITMPPVYDSVYDGTDTAFLTKLDATGCCLVYSTFLDGVVPRFGARQLDVAVDSGANAYVAVPFDGGSGFPSTNGTVPKGVNDVVVMKINPTGTAPLIYSTFVGGTGDDRPNGIAVDADGSVYVTGSTTSTHFPLYPLGPGSAYSGAEDVFIARLSPNGSTLFAGYLGGSDNESANGIALGPQGPCLTGRTSSSDFPTAAPPPSSPFQSNFAGGTNDAFVTCIVAPLFSDGFESGNTSAWSAR